MDEIGVSVALVGKLDNECVSKVFVEILRAVIASRLNRNNFRNLIFEVAESRNYGPYLHGVSVA